MNRDKICFFCPRGYSIVHHHLLKRHAPFPLWILAWPLLWLRETTCVCVCGSFSGQLSWSACILVPIPCRLTYCSNAGSVCSSKWSSSYYRSFAFCYVSACELIGMTLNLYINLEQLGILTLMTFPNCKYSVCISYLFLRLPLSSN